MRMKFPKLTTLTTHQWLAILLVSGFLFTFGYALHFKIVPQVDARTYDSIATNIASGAGYLVDASKSPATDAAIGSVGPIYELFLAFFFWVFGHNLPVVWFVQSLLHIATAFIIFLIARRLFSEDGDKIGLISSGIYIFCIDLIQMPAMIMSETLHLFLLSLTTYAFVRFYESPSYRNTVFFGIVCSLAAMTRPTALLVIAAVVLCAMLRHQYKQAALIIVCTVVLFAPWAIRNYYTYNEFIFTTAAGGYDIWLGNNLGANGGAHPTPEINSYLETHGHIKTSAKGIAEAKSFAIHHPFQVIKLLIWKTTAYWSIARPYAFWFYLSDIPQKIVLVLSVLWSLILFVLGLAGAWILWQSKRPILRWIVAIAVLMPIAVIPIIVQTRYRLPVYPYLSLFAGYFVMHWYRLWKGNLYDKKIYKVVIISSAVIIIIAILDILQNLPLILSRLSSLFT